MEKYETMETYEIDLWRYFQFLFKNKYLIIGIMIFSIILSYCVSEFVIEKEYRTELWIKVPGNYISTSENLIDYLKSYFFYPEVLDELDKNKTLNFLSKEKLKLERFGNLVQFSYDHPRLDNGKELFTTWVNLTKKKMILDSSSEIMSAINSALKSVSFNLNKKEERYQAIQTGLDKESPVIELEVLFMEPSIVSPAVIQELNPIYTKLKTEAELIKLEIEDLRKQAEFFSSLYDDFQATFLELNQQDAANLERSFEVYRTLESDWDSYFNESNGEKNVSLVPFELISAAQGSKKPIKPNTLFNMLIASMFSLLFILIIAYLLVFIQDNKQQMEDI